MLLPTAGDTIINDGHFNSAQTINLNHFYSANLKGRDPYEILKEHVALDALFNSSARFDPPKCHPQTRTAVLSHVDRWSKDPTSLRVLWIRGGAGAGKSAIAQTLSERWDDESYLAATFYFSRTAAGRNEKKQLLPTIAYQLAIEIPALRPRIEDLIRKEPEVFKRNLRTQMKKLIIDPVLSGAESVPITCKVIVIDGLDECCVDYPEQDHEQQQKEILECIHWAAMYEGFPFRFLIASRPERQIREMFEHGTLKSLTSRIVLDNSHNPSADIELYLRCKLNEIRSIHPHLGSTWPTEDVITHLVENSSGHFIYVAVVVRFLRTPRINPVVALNTIMDISHVPNKGGPFAELDALYTYILRSAASDSLPTILNMFRLIIYGDIGGRANDFPDFKRGIKRMSPTFVAKYLFIPLEQLYVDLIDLHSILDIPSENDPSSAPISFLHASFSEFLTQPSRSEEFHIEKEQSSRFVLSLFVQHLHRQALNTEDPEYTEEGFGIQTANALNTIQPDNNILEALRALINVDECVFIEYVHRNKLSNLGATRRNATAIKSLYKAWNYADYNDGTRLGKYPVQGFVPVDPYLLEPHRFSEAVLVWFCGAHGAADSSAVSTDSSIASASGIVGADSGCELSVRSEDREARPGGNDTLVQENASRLSLKGARPARNSGSALSSQVTNRDLGRPEDQADDGTRLPLEGARPYLERRSSYVSTPNCWTGLTSWVVNLLDSGREKRRHSANRL